MTSFLDQLTSKIIAHPLMTMMVGNKEAFDAPVFKKTTTAFFVHHNTDTPEASEAWKALQALQSTYDATNFVLLDVNYEMGPVPLALASVIDVAKNASAVLFVQYDGVIYQQTTPLTP